MRIVRPGSVVGPQQQFMYIKQTEWLKWAAVDELRRAEAQAAAAIAASSIVTPATPPADPEDDDPMDLIPVLDSPTKNAPTTPVRSRHVPPVTPSRHVGAAAAKADAMTPPGQPRKTPVTKRTADIAAVDETTDEEDEEDEIDTLPVLKTTTTRTRAKSQSQATATTTMARAGTKRVTPASEQRPTRITRSTANAAAALARRPGSANSNTTANSGTQTSAGARGAGNGPNKIPRLTQQAGQASPSRSTTSMSTRSRPVAAVPSRLPTLIVNNRRGAAGGAAAAVLTSDPVATGGSSRGSKNAAGDSSEGSSKRTADAWMKKDNAAAVVVPGSKSTRPGLRSVRRRRSSFSAADVVA